MPTPYVKAWLKFKGAFYEFDTDNLSSAVSEGNIITTPADLATWANALYATNTLLSSELQAQMIAGIPTNEEHVNYGLGTELNPPDIGYGHNGARPAYMTVMKYHPGTKTCYILFCNFLDADDIQTQGTALDNGVRQAIQAVKDSQ
jgi:D-alanyl-D-alanine carboxypeptidase